MWTVCPICGAIAAKFDVHLAWHAARDEYPPVVEEPTADPPDDAPTPDPIPDAPEATS